MRRILKPASTGLALAKRELVEALPPKGTAVLNADDPRVRQFTSVHTGRSITFGFAESSEVRAEDVTWFWRRVRDSEWMAWSSNRRLRGGMA